MSCHRKLLSTLVLLSTVLTPIAQAAHENHNDSLCNKSFQIRAALNGQHIAFSGDTLDLTTTVERRATFTLNCEVGDNIFTLSHIKDNNKQFVWAKTEAEIFNNRTYAGNSGNFHLDRQSDGSYAFVFSKYNKVLSVDNSEYFSLVDVGNSGVLANERFYLVPAGTGSGGGRITHIATTTSYDSNGQDLKIARPSGSKSGDLLVLALHRTDDDLPLFVNGWTRGAECYKRDNGYECVTIKDCTRWESNNSFCAYFGDNGRAGQDLAQVVFYKKITSIEPSSYTFNLNMDTTGHPGWAILTALRGANTTSPIRDWAYRGCDKDVRSAFPSVYGVTGDMLLLSQSFDDRVDSSNFLAPSGTSRFGYVSQSDEAGFLFGGILGATGETGVKKTGGSGASNCKDALISLTIKPQ